MRGNTHEPEGLKDVEHYVAVKSQFKGVFKHEALLVLHIEEQNMLQLFTISTHKSMIDKFADFI